MATKADKVKSIMDSYGAEVKLLEDKAREAGLIENHESLSLVLYNKTAVVFPTKDRKDFSSDQIRELMDELIASPNVGQANKDRFVFIRANSGRKVKWWSDEKRNAISRFIHYQLQQIINKHLGRKIRCRVKRKFRLDPDYGDHLGLCFYEGKVVEV